MHTYRYVHLSKETTLKQHIFEFLCMYLFVSKKKLIYNLFVSERKMASIVTTEAGLAGCKFKFSTGFLVFYWNLCLYILYTLYTKRITTITIIFTSFPYYQNLRQVTKVYSLSLLGYVGWWWWFGLLSTRHAYLSPNNKTASDTVEAAEQPSMHTCPTCHTGF